MDHGIKDVLDAWDLIRTFTSYERTPRRIAWISSAYEIEGSVDDWIENKAANVIEEYSKLRKISFDEAQRELMKRPTKPWSAIGDPEQQDPFSFHLKPSGWTGAPCPICGCTAKNLRARHRALKADEAHRWGVPWIKRIKVAFGQDFSDEPIKG